MQMQECEGYNNLICDRADFDSAHIDKEDLLTYVNRNGSVNVPQQIGYKINEKAASLEAIDIYPNMDAKDIPISSFIRVKFNIEDILISRHTWSSTK